MHIYSPLAVICRPWCSAVTQARILMLHCEVLHDAVPACVADDSVDMTWGACGHFIATLIRSRVPFFRRFHDAFHLHRVFPRLCFSARFSHSCMYRLWTMMKLIRHE